MTRLKTHTFLLVSYSGSATSQFCNCGQVTPPLWEFVSLWMRELGVLCGYWGKLLGLSFYDIQSRVIQKTRKPSIRQTWIPMLAPHLYLSDLNSQFTPLSVTQQLHPYLPKVLFCFFFFSLFENSLLSILSFHTRQHPGYLCTFSSLKLKPITSLPLSFFPFFLLLCIHLGHEESHNIK